MNLSCPQSVYRWMRGYALPTVDNLYMLSRLFDVHMEDLLVGKAQADESERNVGE
ncbi:MAG: helix-turn-helix transcriptional regulator [Lachnospiraceae bacterium]|nr:helix-turn-helix transcriptional regulator [Lachnospiraceae bacterium]